MTNLPEDTTQLEALLQKAGDTFSVSAVAQPSRDMLHTILQQSANRVPAVVTNPTKSRYSLRAFISVIVAAVILLVIGSGFYLQSTHTNTNPSPPVKQADASSDQSINQSISQIDSQMDGLDHDNTDVDQSTAQAVQQYQ